MTKLRVLLLSDEEAKSILWCAAAGGHTVHVAGAPSRNRILVNHPGCTEFHPLPEAYRFLDKPVELVKPILEIAERMQADVICPSSFESIQFVTAHREALSKAAALVPLAAEDTVTRLDDKYKFFRYCTEQGIAHPASELVEPGTPIDKTQLEKLTLPVITKPILGAGEVGIVKFDRWPDLYEYLDSLFSAADPGSALLIQEWFAGEDIDFNGFALNGEVIAGSVMRTRYAGKRSRVTLTDFVDNAEVYKLGEDIIRHSRYSGPLNIDMRIRDDDGRVMAIEVNPRFWDRIIISLIDGMNFVDAGIRLAAGESHVQHSKCNSRLWASSIRDLLGAAIIDRDLLAFKAFFGLTVLQFRFGLMNKINSMRASSRDQSD